MQDHPPDQFIIQEILKLKTLSPVKKYIDSIMQIASVREISSF